MNDERFRIGISRDVIDEQGRPVFDPVALRVLDQEPAIAWEYLAENTPNLTADHLASYDAICLAAPGVSGDAVGHANMRARIIARFGVGYDHIDVAALTAHGVLLTINPNGVRRPLATSQLTLILALAQRLLLKDRLTRTGGWAEAHICTGTGLTGRVLGSVGAGNVGRELFRLARPFELRHIACDPFVAPEDIASLGVSLTDFDTVLKESDFLVMNCPLNESTRAMIDARAIGLMKPSAFFINCARGGIVVEADLYQALAERRIAGAALDVFEQEPVSLQNPLLGLDNVIVSPHCICYTDECLRLLAEGSFRAARKFQQHTRPEQLVNPEVLDHPRVSSWFDS